ncbi:MAG: hypothetical protein ACRDE2_16480, partial [Chitinophagaceae bacterium]
MELKDELEFFEELLSKKLHPNALLQHPPSPAQILVWKETVLLEKERIRRCLKKVYFHHATEGLKEQYVQRHQADLVILTDMAFQYIQPNHADDLLEKESDSELVKLYKTIYHSLKDLLEFIEMHLKKYFNQDEHVPLSYQLLSLDKFQSSIKHIKKKFAGIPADKELLQRIITTVNSFVR